MDELPRVGTMSARGALVGAAGGAIFGVFSGLAYFVSNQSERGIPWHVIGPPYLVCAVMSGVLVAGSAAMGIAFLDRFVGQRVWFSPIPAATIGGAIGCSIPGGVGGGVFAAQHMPFMGGIGLFAVPVIATIVIAVALAVHDRMISGKSARPTAAVGSAVLLAILFAGLVALAVRFVGDDRMLFRFRDAATFLTPVVPHPNQKAGWENAHTGLIAVGLMAGVGLGTMLGVYVGSVMACTRRLT